MKREKRGGFREVEEVVGSAKTLVRGELQMLVNLIVRVLAEFDERPDRGVLTGRRWIQGSQAVCLRVCVPKVMLSGTKWRMHDVARYPSPGGGMSEIE